MSETIEPAPLNPRTKKIQAALEAIRKSLLDLTLRNRLLNYRPSKVRGIATTGEDARQVYGRLVVEGRTMGFKGVPDRKKLVEFPQTTPEPTFVDTTDDKLDTAYEVTPLQDRLLRTWSDARTAIEEQGINTLFAAIGILEWRESKDSEKTLRAPLVLVPVALERGERGRFRLKWTGDELGGNLSLTVKLQEVGIVFPPIPEGDEFDIDAYLDAVQRAVVGQPNWTVQRNAIAIDFFSFAKYLMFKDLDPTRWPDGKKPHEHILVGGLLSDGIGRDTPPVPDPTPLDDHRPPGTAFEVCDADSSQTLVLVDTASGKQLVVEGPPGTGKSQTIANIIAEAVATKKTVLFVAEKMAALEVVKRRLDQYEIGDACLELHSHKARKRELLQELARTMELARPDDRKAAEVAVELLETRAQLNDYVRELHRPFEPTGWTPFEAHGELARIGLDTEQPPRGNSDELVGLDRGAFDERRRCIRKLQTLIAEIGTPKDHPFFGCVPTELMPGDIKKLGLDLTIARKAVGTLLDSSAEFGKRLRADTPKTGSEVERLAGAAQRIFEAPTLVFELNVTNSQWLKSDAAILETLGAGVRREELRKRYAGTLREESWGTDVSSLITDLEQSGSGFGRLFKPAFYRSRSALKALCLGALPSTYRERLELAQAIDEETLLTKRIVAADELLRNICGSCWRGLRTEFAPLLKAATWVVSFHRSIATGDLPPTVLRFFDGDRSREGLDKLAHGVRNDLSLATSACNSVFQVLQPFGFVFGLLPESPRVVGQLPLSRLFTWMVNADAAPHRVGEIVRYNRLRADCRALGLESFCVIADAWDQGGKRLEDALVQTWCERVVMLATKDRPALRAFDRVSHDALVVEFQKLDRRMIQANRQRVRASHLERRPASVGSGATGILREQMNLSRRHKPIRRLMKECAGPIQALKPVFMMSPFSIAMFLPPDGPRFDLIVFDEASQVRPEDSIGALLRADQAVVVGDSHQLPPTSFFERTLADADLEGDDSEEDDPHVAAGEMESILSLMRARGADVRDLRWHYRSKYSSLIRVSGASFYPRLDVFPSPEETASNVGLKLHHLPGTRYGRGKHSTQSNPDEAKAVAQAVRAHARTSPGLTLGVAAFSVSQQMAILRELELVRREDQVVEAFALAHPYEPLFVKNLENVQGDERDVILISVGYGRDQEGRMSTNFGPLNQQGGERRLNVLISRARRRCEVFSNFTADDLNLGADAAKGVTLLKTYLKFAATGNLEVPGVTGRQAESPFEESVLAFLTANGHLVHPQVGSAGYFVDLAVVDPDRPGRYLLGIECDGAMYHSAQTARDRDRLREQILRTKGWEIHRIWSTSWFHENQRERERLLAAIESARANAASVDSSPATPVTEQPGNETKPVELARVPAGDVSQLTVEYVIATGPFISTNRELHEVPVGLLADAIGRIVEVEGPVHLDEVLRRIREAAGIQRAGSRIRETFRAAVHRAVARQLIGLRGDFLWKPGMSRPPVRDRSGLVDGPRSLDLIATEEIQELVMRVAAASFHIAAEEIPGEVARQFGFARVTAEMRQRIDAEVATLVANGRLKADGPSNLLVIAPDEGINQ